MRLDLQTNEVVLECGPNTAVDLASVPHAIRSAGFRPDDMRMVARGRFEGSGTRFRPDGWRESLAVGGEWRAIGEEGLDASTHVRVTGSLVRGEADGELLLVPERVARLDG